MSREVCKEVVDGMLLTMTEKTYLLARALGVGVPAGLVAPEMYKLYRDLSAAAMQVPGTWRFDPIAVRQVLTVPEALRGNSRLPGYGAPNELSCTDLHLCSEAEWTEFHQWMSEALPETDTKSLEQLVQTNLPPGFTTTSKRRPRGPSTGGGNDGGGGSDDGGGSGDGGGGSDSGGSNTSDEPRFKVLPPQWASPQQGA